MLTKPVMRATLLRCLRAGGCWNIEHLCPEEQDEMAILQVELDEKEQLQLESVQRVTLLVSVVGFTFLAGTTCGCESVLMLQACCRLGGQGATVRTMSTQSPTTYTGVAGTSTPRFLSLTEGRHGAYLCEERTDAIRKRQRSPNAIIGQFSVRGNVQWHSCSRSFGVLFLDLQ